MSDSVTKTKAGGLRLNLNSLEAARKSYGRILRMAARGLIDSQRFRDLCYGFNGLLQYMRIEKELEIEHRLEQIEAALAERGKV